MSNLPLFVGAIFFALGANIILGYYRFQYKGFRVSGRVKAIEKYIAVYKSADNSRSRTTMFCAHVEYQFEGGTRIVKSISTNQIRHKLGQVLSVLVIKNDDGKVSARINDYMYVVMGAAFAIVGLIAVAVYLFGENGNVTLAVTALIGLTIAGSLLATIFKIFNVPVHSGEDDQHPRKDAILIETDGDFRKEIRFLSRAGYIITWVGLLIGIGMLYWGYDSTTGYGFSPGEFKDLLLDLDGLVDLIMSGQLHSKWHKPLILIGMGSLFTLGSVHSLFYQKHKYGALSGH